MSPSAPTPAAILPRPRVSRRLDRLVSAHPLTVVAAPAGAGKTTALRELVAHRPEPCAWLTVEPRLDDPAALAAALGALIGGDATPSVLAAASADPSRLGGALAADLDARTMVVVIDDAHLLRSPATRSLLLRLAARIGPSSRLVLAARGASPLALGRLRSAGRVATVGAEELRFSAAEARTLADLLGVEADAGALAAATDGSPALLRLALLAGPAGATPVFEYLAEEVLDTLEPWLRDALEDSAILGVLGPEAVAAVTGLGDPRSLVEQAMAAGLPLMTTTGGPRAHDLLRELLLARLLRRRGRRGVQELHRRAARASEDDVDAAEHLLAAGDPDGAAALIEHRGRTELAGGVVQIPDAMLAALPPAQQQRPWIRLLRAARELQRGAADAALPALAALVDAVAQDSVGATWVRLRLADAAIALGDLDGAETHLAALPTELPGDGARVAVEVNRSWIAFLRTGPASACAHLDAAVALALAGGDRTARTTLGQGLSVTQLLAHPDPGALERRLLALDIDAPGPFAASGGLVVAAAAALRGDLATASGRLVGARRAADRLGGLGWTDAELDLLALHLAVARLDQGAATAIVERARDALRSSPVHAQLRLAYATGLARATWDRGDRAAAGPDGLALAGTSQPGDVFPGVRGRACLLALTQRGRGEADAAERTLRTALEAPADPPLLVVGEPVADLAGLWLEHGREREAAALALPWLRALAAGRRLGLVLGFGQQGQALLELATRSSDPVLTGAADLILRATGAATRPGPVEAQGVRISARELEVLRLLARGTSNGAIAAELFITERTVKSHVASLMRKLDARSRTHAVARARELGLV